MQTLRSIEALLALGKNATLPLCACISPLATKVHMRSSQSWQAVTNMQCVFATLKLASVAVLEQSSRHMLSQLYTALSPCCTCRVVWIPDM